MIDPVELQQAVWNLIEVLRQADPTGTEQGHPDYPLRIICDNEATATRLMDALNEVQRVSEWKRIEGGLQVT